MAPQLLVDSVLGRMDRDEAAPDRAVGAHGVVTSAWLLLFLMQGSLVAVKRTAPLRRLGAIGPLLTLAMTVIGVLTVIERARRGYDLNGALGRAAAPRLSLADARGLRRRPVRTAPGIRRVRRAGGSGTQVPTSA